MSQVQSPAAYEPTCDGPSTARHLVEQSLSARRVGRLTVAIIEHGPRLPFIIKTRLDRGVRTDNGVCAHAWPKDGIATGDHAHTASLAIPPRPQTGAS
jgi:hypothetical protein